MKLGLPKPQAALYVCVPCVGEKLHEPAVVSQVYPGVLKQSVASGFSQEWPGGP